MIDEEQRKSSDGESWLTKKFNWRRKLIDEIEVSGLWSLTVAIATEKVTLPAWREREEPTDNTGDRPSHCLDDLDLHDQDQLQDKLDCCPQYPDSEDDIIAML